MKPLALLALALSPLTASPAAADPFVEGLVPVAPLPDAAAARARIPAGGLWFASVGDGTPSRFFIYRVDPDGVFEAYREDGSAIYTFGWADADTLWTLADDGPVGEATGVIVTRFVRGQKEREYRVGHDTWTGPGSGSWVQLMLGPGEVALARCEEEDTDAMPPVCRKKTMRRLEGDAWVYRKKLAKGTKDVVGARYASPLPKGIKAPPGYSVKKAKVDGLPGLACQGPDGEHLWPQESDVVNREFQVQPKKLTWIHAKPPLLAIEGPRMTPIEILQKQTQVLVGCPARTPYGFHWLGDGIWAELVDLSDSRFTPWQWKIWVDDVHVASLHGGMGLFAPAPRPR